MRIRLISANGNMAFQFVNKNILVIDGNELEDVNKLCGFLFSSRLTMDEETAKNKIFLLIQEPRVAYLFVLNKAVYKSCLHLIKSELDRDNCLLYYEDNIVFRYTNLSIGG